uniref:J domain-containing protein n=1 Tax=Populus trichocarpa TaxID=3694 RepID=U5FJS3_POPTR|eukprot:XP_006373458.1 dnaJ homolog subfamily C member 16 [Populus trichocarpa]
MSSMASKIKAYSVPLFLFSLSVFYQLVVLPRSFPASHYDVLGIKRYSSVEEVKEAYDKLSSKWNSEAGIPATSDFIKIQYAYELLTNPLWKRDYDIFGIDEQAHIMDKINLQHAGESISGIDLPLLEATTFDLGFHTFNEFTSQEFAPMFDSSKPWLVLVYSLGSKKCAQFFSSWIDITGLLDGVAGVGILELGELQLAISLAERKPTGKFFFRNGLPSLVAFPSGCKASACLVRFEGDLSTDAVIDWFATKVLGLPRILYYSKESLGQNFLAKSGPHKVKVIFFSKTGARATPFVRQTAKSYWAYTSFAFVLWREEDFSVWWNAFEVESAPAIVFVKDSGVKPVVVHGMVNNSEFLDLVEKNKQQELPQLRSATSMELGCDARGHSRAGNDTISWYCVILAGRLGPELNKLREIMRRIQERLSIDSESSEADKEQPLALTGAFKGKRLTFTWLDGEAQEKYCSYYLHSETSYDTCGPRRDLIDVPKLFIVRYKRNASEDDIKVDTKPKKIFNVFEDEDVDPASQLVARYNGSDEISQIMLWMSEIIRDGDTRNLPFYRSKTPALVPEDSEPIWSRGAQSIFSKSIGIKQRIYNNISRIYDYLGDPRIGPILLLGALMSFGTIWLIRSQSTHPTQASQLSQSNAKDETRARRRERAKHAAKKDQPPSITDSEPKGAYQMPLSDSESE